MSCDGAWCMRAVALMMIGFMVLIMIWAITTVQGVYNTRTEISGHSYTQVKVMVEELPELIPHLAEAYVDGRITITEFYDIKDKHKEILTNRKKQAIENLLNEELNNGI